MFPPDELFHRPRLRLWKARVLSRLGHADAALQALAEVSKIGIPDELQAEVESLRAAALRVKGEARAAVLSGEKSVGLAVSANCAVEVVAQAHQELALALISEGSVHRSRAAPEPRAVDSRAKRRCAQEMAFLNGCLGSAYGSLDKLAESTTHLEESRQQWRKIGNPKELSWTLNNLGVAYHRMGQNELAKDALVEGLSKARESGNERAEAYALVSLADIEQSNHDYARALELYGQARQLCADLGETTLSTHALCGSALTHAQLGDLSRAEALAAQTVVSACERGSTYEVGTR